MFTSLLRGQFKQCLSVLNDTVVSQRNGLLESMHKETISIVCNFLLKMSTQSSLNSEDGGPSLLENFCCQLEELLKKLRSLPPTCYGLNEELCVLYNLQYARLLQMDSDLQHSCMRLRQHLIQTVLRSLNRVKEFLGVSVFVPHLENSLNGYTSQLASDQVSSALHDIIQVLLVLNHPELLQKIWMQTCLWSLIILLENGPSSELMFFSSMKECETEADNKVVWKHGFLFHLPNTISWTTDSADMEVSKCPSVKCLANLLLAASCFHHREWQQCKVYAANVKYGPWLPFSTFLTAGALSEEGEKIQAEVLLFTFLANQTEPMQSEVESAIYNLLAACCSAQGHSHLSIAMLHRSLKAHPTSIAALCTLSQQFKSLQQSEAELECLCHLVKVLETKAAQKCVKTFQFPELETFLYRALVSGHDVSLSQAKYMFAHRYAQLERYEEASKWYLNLIKTYKDEGPPNPNPEFSLPNLLIVCQEAAECLLQDSQHDQCLDLCNRILASAASFNNSLENSPQPLSSDQESVQPDHLQSLRLRLEGKDNTQNLDVGLKCKLSPVCSEEAVGCNRGKKRRWSLSEESEDATKTDGADHWKHIRCLTLLLLYKAEVLVFKEEHSSAISSLTRALDGLMECRDVLEEKTLREERKRLDYQVISDPKRLRLTLQQQELSDNESIKRLQKVPDWHDLASCICLRLADTYSLKSVDCQVLHYSRLALQLQPDSECAQFALCLTLQRMGRGNECCRQWSRVQSHQQHQGCAVHYMVQSWQREQHLHEEA